MKANYKRIPENDNTVDSVLVAFSCSKGPDDGVLVVGKRKGRTTEVINAFQGKEARELYEKLVTKKEKKDEVQDL